MIKNVELLVQSRKSGKSACRKLRKAEQIPGVVYGAGVKKSVTFFAEEKLIKKYSSQAFENAIFTLKSDDSAVNGVKVLLKEVTVRPVNRRPLHVDLLAIDMTKKIKVAVEIRFEGKPEGLSEGGILQPLMRQLEVECLPTEIPEFIAVDVSPLHVGQALHISEINLPANVKAVAKEDLALVTVTVIKDEPVATTAVAADAAATPGAPAAGAPAAAGAKAPAAAAKAPAAPAKK